jgi:hypothetical protein
MSWLTAPAILFPELFSVSHSGSRLQQCTSFCKVEVRILEIESVINYGHRNCDFVEPSVGAAGRMAR